MFEFLNLKVEYSSNNNGRWVVKRWIRCGGCIRRTEFVSIDEENN